METLGIIGGFGPQATAEFYQSVIRECRKRGLSHQPHMVVWNVPVARQIEEDMLLRNTGIERFKPLLIHAAKQLEKISVDAVVLPCNTLHVFANEIQASIRIPLVNLIDITFDHLRSKQISRLGLLATSATIRNNLFTAREGCTIVVPPTHIQSALDKGFNDRVVNHSSTLIKYAVNNATRFFLTNKIQDILLASTDLHGENSIIPRCRFHDTLTIFARHSAQLFLSKGMI